MCNGDGSCGCGGAERVPPRPLPGQAALAVRIGTHGTFLRGMLERLSSSDFPSLSALSTREESDATPALLDAWASVADVLTFYGERMLNEGYLRTATEARSVEWLARLLGYAPRPGVAASVHLAYTLDVSQDTARIPAGSRAQSVPNPGELPQSFETSDDLSAVAALSRMAARLSRPPLVWPDQVESRDYFFAGLGTNLRVNDTVLFTFGTGAKAARALLDVRAVELDAPNAQTRVALHFRGGQGTKAALSLHSRLLAELGSQNLSTLNLRPDMASVQRLGGLISEAAGQPAELILHLRLEADTARQQHWNNVLTLIERLNAVLDDQLVPEGGPPASDVPNLPTSPFVQVLGELRKPASVQAASSLALRRSVRQLVGGANDTAPRLYAALYPQLRPQLYAALAQASLAPDAPLTRVDALRVKAGLFGAAIPQPLPLRRDETPLTVNFGAVWADLLNLPLEGRPEPKVSVLALNAEYPQIKPSSWVIVERPAKPRQPSGRERRLSFHQVTAVDTLSLSADQFSFAARVSVLTLDLPWLNLDEDEWLSDVRLLRETNVYAAAEALDLRPDVVVSPVGGDDEIELDALYPGLMSGRFVIVEGERDDLSASHLRDAELAMVSSVEHRLAQTPGDGLHPVQDWPGDTLHTFIRLDQPLNFTFRRDTLAIHGNVVRASHGETRTEVLGSGDAAAWPQVFALKQGPLTYLSAVTPDGAVSTLTVRVNSVRWHEVPRQNAPGPVRRYVLNTDAGGLSTVQFGARLPTGQENVTATYRSGLGQSGNVAAGQINLLMSKPLGVRAVINPIRASGGADREGRDQIRRNAPRAVMALDRLVSVQDYQDFAQTFAGVGKARARRFVGPAGLPLVHLTLAGAADAPIEPTSELWRTLLAALKQYGDAAQRVQLAARTLHLLVLQADVQPDPDWDWKEVEARLRRALLHTFGFGSRELAQGVPSAEVLSVMQGVPGVVAVNLRVLDSVGESELQAAQPPELQLKPWVPARDTALAQGTAQRIGAVRPADLLMLTPGVPDTLVLNLWEGV